MKINDWLKQAQKKLHAAGIESARLDSQLLVAGILNIDRAKLLSLNEDLSSEQISELNRQLRRRENREPLAYILGHREFYGINFIVTNQVLVPRPETEEMVSYLQKHAKTTQSVLELGTGSGAIAVALKVASPKLHITATDISKPAIEVARLNAKSNNVRLSFIVSDMFNDVTGRFDIVTANLPYVVSAARRQPEIEFEPDIALYGREDGLHYYRLFFDEISRALKPNGWFIIEASPTQFIALQKLAKAQNYKLTPISEYIFVGKKLS